MSGLRYFASALILAAVAAGCGGAADTKDAPKAASSGGGGAKLALVAYSTPQVVYDEVIPAFARTAAGRGVSFSQSYGASGDQSRAVEAGQKADIVAFSLAPDVNRLVKAGLVADNWASTPTKGMVSNSVVVFVVRAGNPKNVQTWDDLVSGDVEVITPNPFTSGGAQWNLMAAYGAQLKQGKTEDEAVEYLRQLLTNTPVQDKSAREALQTFSAGKGDVLLAYENEAIFAERQGQPFEYVVPDQTILIENPVAATKDASAAGKAFVDFLFTDEAQKVYGDEGYRPVSKTVLDTFDYPTPPSLFTIDDLGGWEKVQSEFFDRETGFMAEVQKEVGQPTE